MNRYLSNHFEESIDYLLIHFYRRNSEEFKYEPTESSPFAAVEKDGRIHLSIYLELILFYFPIVSWVHSDFSN